MSLDDGTNGLGLLGTLAQGWAHFCWSKTVEAEHFLLAFMVLIAKGQGRCVSNMLTQLGLSPPEIWEQLQAVLQIHARHFADHICDGASIASALKLAAEEMAYHGDTQPHAGHVMIGVVRYYAGLPPKEPNEVKKALARLGLFWEDMRDVLARQPQLAES